MLAPLSKWPWTLRPGLQWQPESVLHWMCARSTSLNMAHKLTDLIQAASVNDRKMCDQSTLFINRL